MILKENCLVNVKDVYGREQIYDMVFKSIALSDPRIIKGSNIEVTELDDAYCCEIKSEHISENAIGDIFLVIEELHKFEYPLDYNKINTYTYELYLG